MLGAKKSSQKDDKLSHQSKKSSTRSNFKQQQQSLNKRKIHKEKTGSSIDNRKHTNSEISIEKLKDHEHGSQCDKKIIKQSDQRILNSTCQYASDHFFKTDSAQALSIGNDKAPAVF